MIRCIKGIPNVQPGVYIRCYIKDDATHFFESSIMFYDGKRVFSPRITKKHSYGFMFNVTKHLRIIGFDHVSEVRRRFICHSTPTISQIVVRHSTYDIMWRQL